MDWRVTFADVDIGQAEIDAVTKVLEARWLSMGPQTLAFESEFAATLGVSTAVAVSSGTAALHVAALALGLGPGDEVIVPSLSFVATAAMIALTGARPVFAEIESAHDLTLSPADVERKRTSRTKAIVAMHYAGYPADMRALTAVARRHSLALIEDAAHAPAVHTDFGMVGTLGDVGCFSFFATKNLTTGEGGMITARDAGLLARARSLRSHCMTTTSWDKHKGRASSYDVTGLGLNYRPTEMAAALGRVQLGKLGAERARRAAISRLYDSLLETIPGIDLPFRDRNGDSAYHLYSILLPEGASRDAFQSALREEGIQTSVHFPPIHLFTYYRDRFGCQPNDLPVTEHVASREVSLPLHTRLSDDDVQFVADAVHRALGRGSLSAKE